MNKLLLGSAAIAGLVLASAPAQAQMELTIGGHTKNYIGWSDQDDSTADVHEFDMQRETELHFNGESTLDNGLTFGFQIETEMDADDDSNTVEESYIYLSGSWGRVNLGSEDGAAYLLQVAAPSADSNIDGIRQYINPVNYGADGAAGLNNTLNPANFGTKSDGFDYDQDFTGVAEKITYLSPNFNGFQIGASYVFDLGETGSINPVGNGFSTDDDDAYEEAYEVAVRYEGVFSNFGYAIGAGYTAAEEGTAADEYDAWNVGLDIDSGPFGIGAVYMNEETSDDIDTYVVGVDYTTGPFKFGASYYHQDDEVQTVFAGDNETDRFTGGVIYTAGPGLSFRGSISHIEHDNAGTDTEATSAMGGVQINF